MDQAVYQNICKMADKAEEIRESPPVDNVFFFLGDLGYLGYLNWFPRHHKEQPLTWAAIELAASIEGRVWEVLPAFLVRHRSLVAGDLPDEVTAFLAKINTDSEDLWPDFKFVPALKYRQWIRRDQRRRDEALKSL